MGNFLVVPLLHSVSDNKPTAKFMHNLNQTEHYRKKYSNAQDTTAIQSNVISSGIYQLLLITVWFHSDAASKVKVLLVSRQQYAFDILRPGQEVSCVEGKVRLKVSLFLPISYPAPDPPGLC
jgi:hypothetical protein